MDLRNAHPFSKNSPFVKSACGNNYQVTDPHIDAGREAKWEDMMWSIYMDDGDKSKLKLTVQSDSVVIGHVIIRPRELCGLPIDTYGLTSLELPLLDGRTSGLISGPLPQHAGRIRILCRLEAHFQEVRCYYYYYYFHYYYIYVLLHVLLIDSYSRIHHTYTTLIGGGER